MVQPARRTILLLSVLITGSLSTFLPADDVHYGIGTWDAGTYGTHRAVIHVSRKAYAVWIHLPWRRRDQNPQDKEIIVVDGLTGTRIPNVFRAEVNREFGDLVFQPQSVPADYYVYFLPYVTSGRPNYPIVTYLKPGDTTRSEWLAQWGLRPEQDSARIWRHLPQAELVEFQSIDEFNSFSPMELIATADELKGLLTQQRTNACLLFPEDRRFPIRMTEDLPYRWIQRGPQDTFQGEAMQGEFYAFQVGVYAPYKRISDLRVRLGDLKGNQSASIIPASAIRSFNTGGIDWQGRPFRKPCSVEKGKVKPLWFGIQVPEGSQPDTYEGSIQLVLNDGEEKVLHLKLGVVAQKLLDSGDSEPWRHSRLRWLDSQLAADDELVSPFTPVRVEGNRVSCLGRQVLVGQDGMPQGIQSFFAPEMTVLSDHARELLSSPIRFVVEDSQHRVLSWSIKEFQFTRQTEGAAAWRSLAIAEDLQLEVQAQMEFDGNNEFNLHLRAAQTTRVSDIRLEVPLHRDVARYMMGMNVLGGIRPKELRWKWNQKRNQDSAWVGDVNAGVQLTLKAENYERPLNTNFYLLKPLNMPISWYNDGKGGCNFLEADSQTFMVRAYSGPREIEAGRSLHFNFRLMLTPFKLLDTQGQWNSRYYHAFKPVSEVLESGANIVNVHHANSINPFINYPFLHCEEMKAYIDEAHQKGLKVKIYYTVRELSNHASELFALRSLDDEIFSRGSGGGSSWLQEHLGSNYIAAWFVPELEDAAIITSGESRWHNYYVEGVNWLAKNIGIDGLYIDDVAFDRTIMKRVRKVLDHSRPGALIDLHSANQFNARDGFANSANLYLEHFPYLNRLWFGEYFDYNARPDFWLIEMSGIPFGLMGEMLQDGGNPWRGMVYGMTGRLPWAGDPRPLWKVWDEFGINQSRMIGYWVPNCPVKSSHPNILATAYVRNDKTLVAVASWAKDEVRCHLAFDWKTLRLEASKCRIKAPAIAGFQEAASYAPEEEIIVPPGRGWLLILSDR